MTESSQLFKPSASLSANAHVKNMEEYHAMYQRSIECPEDFWAEVAEDFHWYSRWNEICSFNYDRRKGPISIEWFQGAKTNVCHNCIDRHLEIRPDKTAIIWEGNEPGEDATITYRQLHEKVCKFANFLKSRGVKKGDCVSIYMPMILEAAVAMLACARIGAVHSVVFGGFSAEALADRIVDSNCKTLITANGTFRGPKAIPMKPNADQAMKSASNRMNEPVQTCVVVNRVLNNSGLSCEMLNGRDIWWEEAVSKVSSGCPCEEMDAEDPLFILYTSGSTGKPKGVLHTTGGYMVYTATTHKYVFDYHEDDVYFCAADIGWITGHSYIVYGPLANGATTTMFESIPTYPNPDRYWQVIEKWKVNQFYTAPTAIRAIAAAGENWPSKYSMQSLRILGSVGEPINPEAWRWYFRNAGKEKCPIVDTWWQTETGGILISPLPGATPLKPGSATFPFFGVKPVLLDSQSGEIIEGNESSGILAMESPWPGQMRTIFGNHNRFEETYFDQYKGFYFTGDGCRRDKDGYYWITGRVDDVINVSGHRMGTAEVESALVAHNLVAEAAVVGFPHEVKGEGIYAFVTLNAGVNYSEELRLALKKQVREVIGPIATPDVIHWAPALPKTRSGKIMRRILRKIATKETDQIGDVSTLADPSVVQKLIDNK